MRINKYLAQEGYATRRGADALIEEGKIFINGKLARLGDNVSDEDKVVVKGVKPPKHVYLAYYKPRGVVTIGARRERGEKEIKDVALFNDSVFPIGRLDKESEGLIIMTNDGRITNHLIGPTSETDKEYRVTVDRPITHQMLVKMRTGISIDVGRKKYKTKRTKIRRVDKNTFDIVLTEGKNRQIRKMAGSLGYKVTSLKRMQVGAITLESLKPNQFRKISRESLI